MLGKLIKHDFKALNRFLLIMHGFLLLFAVAVRIFLPLYENVIFSLFLILYILFLIGVSFATYITIAVHFYKNLFSDEGYLTRTLPVSRGTHLLSKTITGTVWAIANLLLIIVSLCITISMPEVWNALLENKVRIMTGLGLPADFGLLQLVLSSLVVIALQCFTSVCMVYVSVMIGQLFTRHRILGSVVAYFSISTVLSLLSFVAAAVATFSASQSSGALMYLYNPQSLAHIVLVSTLFTFILGVIFYIVSHLILVKKADLP
ncbi:hypothetical protein FYJ34_09470 [Clostridiaceae bacterium 68-1-5]|uniref:Uncharacterized protein n=1 Tax=Suipraeoptans intestinalis TaxID=2606628 RepID=A0A6N7UTE3_9FIRM|nr:hypothetical protein [Suipraeoptans intestinalis]MSR94478.1 hypothetical protein [Suipraeoptans intestinalis]